LRPKVILGSNRRLRLSNISMIAFMVAHRAGVAGRRGGADAVRAHWPVNSRRQPV